MAVGSLSKTVAAAATPERVTTISRSLVNWATIQAKSTNTQPIIVGTESSVASGYTIANPGDSFVIWSTAGLNLAIDLNKVWVKVGVDGEGFDVFFVK